MISQTAITSFDSFDLMELMGHKRPNLDLAKIRITGIDLDGCIELPLDGLQFDLVHDADLQVYTFTMPVPKTRKRKRKIS